MDVNQRKNPRERIELNQLKLLGLNSDASKLNFPIEATIFEKNFDVTDSGIRYRRRGMIAHGEKISI